MHTPTSRTRFDLVNVGAHDVAAVLAAIPEFDPAPTLDKITERCALHQPVIGLGVRDYANGDLVAVKLGYGLNDTTFYSWLGGVLPDMRRYGLASQLRIEQERRARQLGFTTLRIKTMRLGPAMTRMLDDAGYRIVALEGDTYGSKLVFETQLDDVTTNPKS